MPLAVTEHGDAAAPGVVLLHGLGTTGWTWRRVLPHPPVGPLLAGAFPHGTGRLVPGRGHAWVGETPSSSPPSSPPR